MEELKKYLENEKLRIEKELHIFGNQQRNEYSGILLGKAEIVDNILYRLNNTVDYDKLKIKEIYCLFGKTYEDYKKLIEDYKKLNNDNTIISGTERIIEEHYILEKFILGFLRIDEKYKREKKV